MEAPFADSTRMEDRAEDRIQLSSAIADQILDKAKFGANAQEHFKDWDKDNNQSLSLRELSDVYKSREVTYEERATASILSQNIDLFSGLCANSLGDDPNRNSYTTGGYSFLKSQFGNDRATKEFTIKDLNVLSMVTSKNGELKFVEDAEQAEKASLGLFGVFAGINGTLALTTLARVFGRTPIGVLDDVFFAASTAATLLAGKEVVDAHGKNDLQLMEMQFKQRQAMLNSLDVPRL
jgi:hypothetical protein